MDGASSAQLWLSHLKDQWLIYVTGILCVMATNVADVAIPKITQVLIDLFTADVSQDEKSKSFSFYIALLLSLIVAQFFGRIGWRLTLGQQTHKVASRLKSMIWDRSRYLPKNRLDTDLNPGELMNIATGDVGIARFMFGFTLVGTVDFIFLMLLTIIMMLSIDVSLTLASLIILPVLPFFLDKLARRESTQHQEAQKSLSTLTDLAAQAVSTIRLQRVTQTGGFWQKKLLEQADRYRERRFNVVRTSLAFIPVTGVAPLVSYVILLILGLKKVFAGDITVGAFVAMQSYIFIIQGPMIELGVIISEWQRSFASLERVKGMLVTAEAEGLRSGGKTVVSAPVVFKARNVSFHYPNSTPILSNLNFEVKQGERLGIKGPIGSGKTTLVNILAGFERNFTGDIELFNGDIRSYAHLELRKTIALVPQKPFLFADSVRNNLKLHRNLDDEEIWKLLAIAGLQEDVENFEHKLDTKLGEWGINLSGGQKQRLTLARALADGPSILILDDCLSAVDTITEEKIIHNLNRELKNLTTIWIAHRSSTLRFCDQVIEIAPLEKNSTSGSGELLQ